MSGRSASCRSFEQRKRQQLTRFYVKEQAVNQNQLRRFGVSVDLCLDTDTCFIDVALWIALHRRPISQDYEIETLPDKEEAIWLRTKGKGGTGSRL